MPGIEGIGHQDGKWWETFSPLSAEFKHAKSIFHSEGFSFERKVLVVALSSIAGLFFIIGAFPVFRWTVNWLKPGDNLSADKSNSVFTEKVSSSATRSEQKAKTQKSKQELQVPQEILEKLHSIVEEMFQEGTKIPKEHPEVEWISRVVHKAFKINGILGYIFEMPGIGAGRPTSETETSFEILTEAKKICREKGLTSIPLPCATLFKTTSGRAVIIKEQQDLYLMTQYLEDESDSNEGEYKYYHKLEEKMPECAKDMKKMKALGPFKGGISIMLVDDAIQPDEWKIRA